MVTEEQRIGPAASQFERRAGSMLAALGLQLVNDPAVILSPYQKSQAIYRSECGLYLLVDFEPADGNTAGVSFGRRWSDDSGWYCLSNALSVVAKRCGLAVPRSYKLGYGDEIPRTIETIQQDLQRILPTVLCRVTVDDLSGVEREENGAQRIAEQIFGPDYRRQIEISSFSGKNSNNG